MINKGHSRLGGSSAYRWARCPASPRICDAIPPVKETEFMREGTAAHVLAAECLRSRVPANYFLDSVIPFGSSIIVPFSPGMEGTRITEDMCSAVSVLCSWFEGVITSYEGMSYWVEAPLSLETLHEDAWGTADLVMYSKESRILWVVDYKHGAGKPVPVENNYQLRYYALGVLLGLPDTTELSEIRTVIIQPRCVYFQRYDQNEFSCLNPDGVFEEWLRPEDLISWGVWLARRMHDTDDPDAPAVPGSHCQFCPACPHPTACPYMRELNGRLISLITDANTFEEDSLSEEFLASIAPYLEDLQKRVTVLSAAAIELARRKRIQGMKLIKGIGRRAFTDEGMVVKVLGESGLPEDSYLEPRTLMALTKIEKSIGPGNFKRLLGDFVSRKESGAARLVSTNTKGEEIQPSDELMQKHLTNVIEQEES